MNKLIISILTVTLLASCNSKNEKTNKMTDKKKQTEKSTQPLDTTPRVTGIGGIFFFTEDTEKTKKWYSDNLGLATDDYGSSFEFRNAHHQKKSTTYNGVRLKKVAHIFRLQRKNL